MRRWLLIISAASLLVYPFAARAADYGSSRSSTGNAPPVAQPLVREGDFAIKLAAVLDIGTPTDEAAAEDLLANAGIAPLNGWLSDYPMTPQVIGQLEESISRAASQGKLPMTSDQAVKGLYAITAQYNLPAPAEQGSASQGSPPPAPQSRPDQQIVNNYYYDAGPPVVTYYPPPYDYAYLYDWVPYPVWWFGFWYPGFYICHSFTTVVVVQTHPVVVSNHFVDHHTGHVVTVDPGGRRGGHGKRPDSVLRTERGERFMTLADMRRGIPAAGDSGDRRQRAGERTSIGADHNWTPQARRSAGTIYSRNMNMRVPRPERGSVRPEGRSGSREGVQRSSSPPAGQHGAGEHSRSRTAQRYASNRRMGGNDHAWGNRHVAQSSRPFSSELQSSRAVQRSAVRTFKNTGNTGGREGFGRTRLGL